MTMPIKQNNDTDKHALFECVLLLMGMILLLVCTRPYIDSDATERLKMVQSFFSSGPIYASQFSLIQPLISSPLYWIGDKFMAGEKFLSYYNMIVFFAFVGCIFIYLRKSQGTRFARRTVMLVMCASMIPYTTNNYFGELTTLAFFVIGYMLTGKREVLGFFLIGIGAACTPATVPAFGLLLAFETLRRRKFHIVLYIALPLVIFLIENWLKFGSLTKSPYLQASHGGHNALPYSGLPGFSYPIAFGLISLLFSTGKGLFWFVPSVFLPIVTRLPTMNNRTLNLILAFTAVTVGLLLLYARWWAWNAGAVWGPRFFIMGCIPAVLFMTLLLDRKESEYRWTDLWLLPALALSVWTTAQGFTYGLQGFSPCQVNSYQLEFMCTYVPEFSPIWRAFVIGFSADRPWRIPYSVWCLVTGAYLLWQPACMAFRHARRTLGPKVTAFLHDQPWRL